MHSLCARHLFNPGCRADRSFLATLARRTAASRYPDAFSCKHGDGRMKTTARDEAQFINRTVLASTISALLAGGGAAQAQEAGLEEITVTGSRIVRRDLDAASPIVTIAARPRGRGRAGRQRSTGAGREWTRCAPSGGARARPSAAARRSRRVAFDEPSPDALREYRRAARELAEAQRALVLAGGI